MAVTLDMQNASNSTQLPSQKDLQKWCALALSQRSNPSELTIRLVDEAEGRTLNQQWCGKDYATNVLSFAAEIPEGILDIPLLGDLVICAPVVEREAQEQNKQLQAHWAHMVIHGCLHLLGYDHIEEEDAQEMEQLEQQLMAELNYADPYAETE
ncbi:MAG: rRNA maturation RNase YbeY [Thiopseudomonas sp.]|nr:rRNA maturation RNase YbeY [Thiopseudomonas sp.]MCK9464708.1 rRNA maturation RNase YbeY [Thiopseudomonas sp.]